MIRPISTADVAAPMALAGDTATPVVPIGGNTGVSGGTHAPGAALMALEPMNAIRETRTEARVAVLGAGWSSNGCTRPGRTMGLPFR